MNDVPGGAQCADQPVNVNGLSVSGTRSVMVQDG
jgi:hypothetical protein